MAETRYQPEPNVVFEVTDEGALLLNESGTHLITLNAVGATLWSELTEPRSVPELALALQQRFPDEPTDRLADDCRRFANELMSNGLIHAVG